MTKKDMYKKKNHFRLKLLIGVLLLSGTIVGNIGVAFADQDINSLLTNWFTKKGQESISAIENAIATEKEQQKIRLKEELQSELKNSAQLLEKYTKEEKQKRILALQQYADKLIEDMKLENNQAEKQRIAADMDKEIQKAIKELEKIRLKGK
ncbi:hypothetical protein [Neobacillus vireti]|uniref:Uncharacterized protein n=1 Tax=Neobacillus vireti LMG 21834 TaxID=1131730 RepID=A0AB94ISU1_9BACI|nr:hypothetical protein [Neobacillus vireti]ETI70125.1 hypothetical protein BAVI_03529 [Neobacillus vireti LMG 21834]KLT16495.1 hypothetical protein AA980_18700 [Neobacillus vireti]